MQDRHALRILVVEDHPLLASEIAAILSREEDLKVVAIAHSGAEAATIAATEMAGVVLMDFALPDMSGPAATGAIRAQMPDLPVVFHNADETDTALLDAIDAGASAFLTRSASPQEIVDAVRRASRGEVMIPVSLLSKALVRQRNAFATEQHRQEFAGQFTTRELQILKLLASGFGTAEMSQSLGVSANTIEWHVGHVIDKLGVHSKLQAVIAAARLGLIHVETS